MSRNATTMAAPIHAVGLRRSDEHVPPESAGTVLQIGLGDRDGVDAAAALCRRALGGWERDAHATASFRTVGSDITAPSLSDR